MTVIFNYAPNSEITKQLETIKTRLEQHNPVVSKIDLDCGLLQEVIINLVGDTGLNIIESTTDKKRITFTACRCS